MQRAKHLQRFFGFVAAMKWIGCKCLVEYPLSEIRYRLTKLLELGGVNVVKNYLQEELISIEYEDNNSWLAAMYRAAINSKWFCEGGFMS